ncbi:GTPase [Muricoccus radiodurans]|uniref:GTPase n=1 Tax=Muricoccus radiodurans TaxID=2231721 RepID=UPI003CF9E9A0
MFGAALGAVRRLLGRWRETIRAPGWAAERGRILLIGPTGAGKSTLVNAFLGADTAGAGSGAPVTAGTTWHTSDGHPVAFGDTRGLEVADSAEQVARLEAALTGLDAEVRPHLVWLVVNAESARAFAGEGTLGAVAAALRGAGIPALVVLTHAEPGEEHHARLRARIAAAMPDVPVLPVNTCTTRAGDGTELIAPHGLDALRDASLPFLPDGARRWPSMT